MTFFINDYCFSLILENGSLTNCLHLFRNVSLTSVRTIIAEMICALDYLHKTHSLNFPNLSPETIYISHKSHIVLTDFAFAMPKNDPKTKQKIIYRTGPSCYAPPEFLSFGNDDFLSDSWRLGVLMYHLLNGKPPFSGTRDNVCNQICQGTFVFYKVLGSLTLSHSFVTCAMLQRR